MLSRSFPLLRFNPTLPLIRPSTSTFFHLPTSTLNSNKHPRKPAHISQFQARAFSATANLKMPTLYETTIPVFIKQLTILSKLLEAGVEHSKDGANALTEEGLVSASLIADMKGLGYQIQRVSDTSKGVAVRVGKVTPVAFEDNETTFPELQKRINKTIKFLEGVDADDFNKHEDDEVKLPTRSGEVTFTGKSYVLNFALPNFFFHFVTAYDILRAQGVPIGKENYLGRK